MAAPNPPDVPSTLAPVESNTTANPVARSAAAQLEPGAMADSGKGSVKRKRQVTHIIVVAVPASSAATPPPASKVATKTKAPVKKALVKKASLVVLTAAVVAALAADGSYDRDSSRYGFPLSSMLMVVNSHAG
jgi:hypothetical protein